jgi:hypothetical protein
MSPLSRKSSRMHTSLTACTLSLLLSSSAWAETIHVHVPTVRIKPVVVPVKPTVHLPVSAGLGRQRLSNGGTAPGRWHGPNKGDTPNGSTAPASPGAAAYSATVNAPAGAPVGVVAGPKGATKGGTNASSPGAAAYGVTIGKPPAGTTAGEKGTPVFGAPSLQVLGLGPDWFANARVGLGCDSIGRGTPTCLDAKQITHYGLVVVGAGATIVAFVAGATGTPAIVAGGVTTVGYAGAIAIGAALGLAIEQEVLNSQSEASTGSNNYGPGASAPGGAPAPGSSSASGSGDGGAPTDASAVEANQADAGAMPGDGKGDGDRTPMSTNSGDNSANADTGGSGGGAGGAGAPQSGTPTTTEAAQQQSGASGNDTGNDSTSGGSNGGGPNGTGGSGPVGGNGSTAQSAETPTGTSSGDQSASTSNTVSNTGNDDHGSSDAGTEMLRR